MNVWSEISRIVAVFCAAFMVVGQGVAQTGPYSTTTSATINAATTCTAPVTRTINVPDSFTVSDLDLGFLAAHTWRTDIQLDLTSPAGTTVRLINAPANLNYENYNVILNDGAADTINTGSHASSDGSSAPPYENNVRPDNGLGAFVGETALGTWTLTMCDTFPGADDGQFLRADLFFNSADLALSKTANTLTPAIGATVTFTITVSNSGPGAASGVQVRDLLPSGLAYASDTGSGAYNSGSGVWNIAGPIAAGSTRTLQIAAIVNASGSYTNLAEIMAADQPDPDSTPNNSGSAPSEDDTAFVALSPSSGSGGGAPTLSCSSSAGILDWDVNSWPQGTLSQSYSASGETFSFSFSGSTSRLVTFGGQNMPATSTDLTGGLTPTQTSLLYVANFPNTSQSIGLTFSVGASGVGVSKLQFTIFDVDVASGGNNTGFVDQLQITGSYGGALVIPLLTSSAANTATGTTATGTASAASTSGDGNLVVTFTSPVDDVTITYGSGPGTPNNPGQQGIAIHDISFCKSTPALLTAVKSVSLYDPANSGLFHTPGNDVLYTISVMNSGDGAVDADSVFIVDTLPAEVEFYNGDVDDAGPETAAVAFLQNGAGLTFSAASDIRYSNSAVKPTTFAECSYSPVAGYDAAVRHICINPKGAMQFGDPDPSFSIVFRTRIK